MGHFAAVFVVLLLTSYVEARTITWKEAVELAEKNNADLQSALATYNSVKALELGSASGFLPHVSGSLRGSESSASGTSTAFSYSAGLSLSQNLFSGLSDYYSFQLKKVNSEQALNDLNTVKAKISQELKQTFAETYYSQENQKLSENILKRRKENVLSVKLQYDVGRENKGSLLLSQANVESAELDLLHAKNDAEVAAENFRRYLALPDTEEITIDANIEREALPPEPPDFKKLADSNLDVMKQRNDELVARYNSNISRAKFIPSLDFNANYGYSDTKFYPQTENDNWSLGLTLTVPLFDGFRDLSAHNSDVYKQQATDVKAGNVYQLAIRDLKKAYYDYVEALQSEKVAGSFSQASQMRAEIGRSKYKNGLLSFEDWDQIENDQIQKQKDFIVGEKNRIIKQSLWEKAQGTGVFK
jgi:outer membrane protein TolC